jgi:hypothetical protein
MQPEATKYIITTHRYDTLMRKLSFYEIPTALLYTKGKGKI